MTPEERYTEVCQPWFKATGAELKEVNEKVSSIMDILKGKDDNPGWISRLRNLERSFAVMIAVITAMVLAFIPSFVDMVIKWFQR